MIKGNARSEHPQRFRAPFLLAFGACCCIIGFLAITVIGVIDFEGRTSNPALRVEYKSGNGYFPATVSEMVHNQDSPGGRVFHTFGMMAGICIFMSFYPFHLTNCYTGDATLSLGPIEVYWTTLRQIFPAMGLMLLVGVNTYPLMVAYHSLWHTKMVCVFIHFVGAGMLFVGYLICELKCLAVLDSMTLDVGRPRIGKNERAVRYVFAYLILVSFVCFVSVQAAMVVFKTRICCSDEWAMKGEEVTTKDKKQITIMGEPQVVNTASDKFLWLKILSFVFEDLAGVCMVFSHLAIWFYCLERKTEHGKVTLTA